MRLALFLFFTASALTTVVACSALGENKKSLHNTNEDWNHKRAAISLTYDDALNTHLDYVVPALDAKGFKGTFYLTASFPPLSSRIEEWRKAAAEGHELGNHTLFHPCRGGEGRDWLNPENDLRTWSEARFINNYKVVNTVLEAIDGKRERTLAYPCGDTEVGADKLSYVDAIKLLVPAARSAFGPMQTREQVESDLYAISAQMAHEQTGAELIKMVDEAIEKKALLVFMFHGVGGEHSLNVSKEAHAQLLDYLLAKEKDIWVAPLIDIVHHLKAENSSL